MGMFKQPWCPPSLLESFDPIRTFFVDRPLSFRDEEDELAVEDDEAAADLLLLCRRALIHLLKDGSSEADYNVVSTHAKTLIRNHSMDFDLNRYMKIEGERVAPVSYKTYSFGSVAQMILHSALLDRLDRKGAVRAEDESLWCLLSLMWIDEALKSARDGEPFEAIKASLRASDVLTFGCPSMNLEDAQRILASQNGRLRGKKNPMSAHRPATKKLWMELKEMPEFKGKKAPLAREITQRLPEYVDEGTLTRWFLDFERDERRSLGWHPKKLL